MSVLRQRFDELAEAGDTESFGERRFISLYTLESGARCGIVEDLGWALAHGPELVRFAPGTEKRFVEVLEQARADFEAGLEHGAVNKGFAAQDLVWSFPAIELVRALLATGSPHFTRVALLWLLPTELRELRAEIERAADDARLPDAVRDLARRLVVPKRVDP
jgi:hypothetical protein